MKIKLNAHAALQGKYKKREKNIDCLKRHLNQPKVKMRTKGTRNDYSKGSAYKGVIHH